MHVSTAESDSNSFLLARVLKPPLCAPTCSYADLQRAHHKLLEARGRAPAPARPDVGTVTLQHIAGRMIPGSHKIAPRRRAHLALATLFARHPACHQTCSHRREGRKSPAAVLAVAPPAPPPLPAALRGSWPAAAALAPPRGAQPLLPPCHPFRLLWLSRRDCVVSGGSAVGNASCRAARADAASCRAAPQAVAASCRAAQAVASGGFGIVALTLVSSSVASEALLTRNR
jgi:hypothetical protein